MTKKNIGIRLQISENELDQVLPVMIDKGLLELVGPDDYQPSFLGKMLGKHFNSVSKSSN